VRELPKDVLTEVLAVVKRPVFLIEAEFRTALVRFWTGSGKLTWRGVEWSAPSGALGGAVLSMEKVVESAEVEATGFKLILAPLREDLLGYAADELRISKKFRMWVGFVDAAGALVEEPVSAFKGWMDSSEISEDADGPKIALHVETELRRLQIPSNRILTAEDQKIDFPSDTAFRWMNSVQTFKGAWGNRQVVAGSRSGPATGSPSDDRDTGRLGRT